MNRYLEKIAKSKKDEGLTAGEGATVGVGIHIGTNAAEHLINRPVINSFDQKPSLDKSTLKKILRDNKDLDITFSHHKAFNANSVKGKEYKRQMKYSSSGPAALHKKFMNSPKEKVLKKNYVHMGGMNGSFFTPSDRIKNIDVALHEMGHIRQFQKIPDKAMGTYAGAKLGSILGAKVLGAGHIAGGAMLSNKKARKYAWAAPLAVAAPMVADEAAANYHGYKMVAKHGTSAMKRRFLGLAGKNLLGYGGASAAGSLILHHMAKNLDKEDAKK